MHSQQQYIKGYKKITTKKIPLQDVRSKKIEKEFSTSSFLEWWVDRGGYFNNALLAPPRPAPLGGQPVCYSNPLLACRWWAPCPGAWWWCSSFAHCAKTTATSNAAEERAVANFFNPRRAALVGGGFADEKASAKHGPCAPCTELRIHAGMAQGHEQRTQQRSSAQHRGAAPPPPPPHFIHRCRSGALGAAFLIGSPASTLFRPPQVSLPVTAIEDNWMRPSLL